MKNNILLVGPKVNVSNKRAYGGGTGGYTRNMKVYLRYFRFEGFEIIPCFHSIRGEINLWVLNAPLRLFYDLYQLIRCFWKFKIRGVHIIAQYRGALLREVLIVLISSVLKKPILYEIKAGSFESTYYSNNKLYKFLINYIIRKSKILLVEGKPYINFLKNNFNRECTFFPNVVPNNEIPNVISEKFNNGFIRVLFVGFACKNKGVFELFDACEKLSSKENNIILTVVGEVHDDFKNYVKGTNLNLILKGKLNHIEVLKQFNLNDIYCYPSKHSGEGHNNTINEALMNQMIICSSLNGFLGSFLNEDNSFPLKKVCEKEIVYRLNQIIGNKTLAIDKSKIGRQLILSEFNTNVAKLVLEKEYKKLLK
jgi:glycosyltransferase involved in cell wall biosynthesis